MVEIEITNYQSIAHTKLVIDGFTTLVGRNYLGKSAVLRAVNAALTNKQGTDFIRWGQTFCEVRLKFPDLDILWHKEDGNNFYKINPGTDAEIVYTKIGKDEPPKEILEAGFKPVLIGDQKINLNYAVQFVPLFLVDKQDSRGADLLTAVYGLDRIYKAIDLCNKEQRSNSDLLRIREKDLQIVERGLERFGTFPDILSSIPQIKEKRKKIDGEEQKIIRIKAWDETFKVLYQSCKRMKPVSDIKIPEVDPIKNSITSYQQLIKYKTDRDKLAISLKKIQPALEVKLPEGRVGAIKEVFSAYQQLLKWSMNYKSLVNDVKRLEGVTSVVLPSSKTDTNILPELKVMYEKAVTLSTEIKQIKGVLEKIEGDMVTVQEEINTFDICPLCGAKRHG